MNLVWFVITDGCSLILLDETRCMNELVHECFVWFFTSLFWITLLDCRKRVDHCWLLGSFELEGTVMYQLDRSILDMN